MIAYTCKCEKQDLKGEIQWKMLAESRKTGQCLFPIVFLPGHSNDSFWSGKVPDRTRRAPVAFTADTVLFWSSMAVKLLLKPDRVRRWWLATSQVKTLFRKDQFQRLQSIKHDPTAPAGQADWTWRAHWPSCRTTITFTRWRQLPLGLFSTK